MKTINYTCKSFDELSVMQLYQILHLRQEVFVVEQNCAYQDVDGKDIYGFHVLGLDIDGNLHCYTRLLPESISYEGYTSIGRVINSSKVRGQGHGKLLMEYSIQKIKELFPDFPVKIGAQAYLKRFYESFGFIDIEMPYIEDGIPHIIMVML